jgi:hypothetical protein
MSGSTVRLLFAIWRRFHHFDSTLSWTPMLVVKAAGRGNFRPFDLTCRTVSGIAPGDLIMIGGVEPCRVLEVRGTA